jgi:hypothetical protein
MAVTTAPGGPLRALFCIYYLLCRYRSDGFISLIPTLNELLPLLDRESLYRFYLPPRSLPLLKLLLMCSM